MGICFVEELHCGSVAVWGSCSVGELQYEVVALYRTFHVVWEVALLGSCIVRELHCEGVAVWGSCSVGELQCGGVAL